MSVEKTGRYLDPGSVEYEAGTLSTQKTLSARGYMMSNEMGG
jgi:hypothetical protein